MDSIIVNTLKGDLKVSIYSVDDFPYNYINEFPLIRKRKLSYVNSECAFDIETTAIYCKNLKNCELMKKGKCKKEKCDAYIDPFSFMYHWQFALYDKIVFGRTWEEFQIFISRLQENSSGIIVIYCHNLSFEFQFMRRFFPFKNVFARKKRKVMKASFGKIEFRCSYFLTNMSLAKFIENTPENIYYKDKTDMDYDVIRTPSTELTALEKNYCYKDVRGLTESLRITMVKNGDTIATIPLTKTGYVRRECRSAFRSNPANIRNFQKFALSYYQYRLCKEEFRGGNTHANRMFTGEIIEKVRSKDIQSSYPYQMLANKYPCRFIKGNSIKILEYMEKGYACLFRLKLINIIHISPHNIPYISIAKCSVLKNVVNDNGRVLSASEVIITVTEIDYKIIVESYSYESMAITDLYIAEKDFLSSEIRNEILKYFRLKTMLKGIEEKAYEYMKSKNDLNSIYGMMVMDIVSETILYESDWIENELKDFDSERVITDSLKRYYNNRNSFLSYQHGIYVTAHARNELEDILNITASDTVYCDTDSDKYIGDHEKEIEDYNNKILSHVESLEIKPQVERDGKLYTMGIFEDEGVFNRFITLGAKKYCYEKKGKIYTVVSGLSKEEGSKEITKEGMESFEEGHCFFPSGRSWIVYNDDPIHEIEINGEKIITASNIGIVPSTYLLGLTEDYKKLLDKRMFTC